MEIEFLFETARWGEKKKFCGKNFPKSEVKFFTVKCPKRIYSLVCVSDKAEVR